MSEELVLLTCPFCGKEASRYDGFATCADFKCPGYSVTAWPEEWNRRAENAELKKRAVTWTSVEEGFPESRGSGWPILTAGTLNDGRKFTNGNMWFEDGDFWQWDVFNIPEKVFNITHWAELPDHPKPDLSVEGRVE